MIYYIIRYIKYLCSIKNRSRDYLSDHTISFSSFSIPNRAKSYLCIFSHFWDHSHKFPDTIKKNFGRFELLAIALYVA